MNYLEQLVLGDLAMVRRLAKVILLTGVVFGATMAQAGVKFGINAPRGGIETQQRWGALVNELSAAFGDTVELVGLSPEKLEDAVAAGTVDFALANPVSAVSVIELNGAKPLAALKANGVATFSGVIITKSGAGINSVADIKGRKVMAYQIPASAGAYVFQAYHLHSAGLSLPKDVASLTETKKQDDIALAVKAGIADVGFVRTGILESLVKDGKVAMADFTVIDQQKDAFPFVHSTALYPEWVLVSVAAVKPDVAAKFATTVRAVNGASEGAKTAKIDGFVDAPDLSGLKSALKALKLPPYDK